MKRDKCFGMSVSDWYHSDEHQCPMPPVLQLSEDLQYNATTPFCQVEGLPLPDSDNGQTGEALFKTDPLQSLVLDTETNPANGALYIGSQAIQPHIRKLNANTS